METRVIRSPRRRRTISAQIRGGVIEVLLPAGMSRREEDEWVDRMRTRLLRRRIPATDADLQRRAVELSQVHLGGQLLPSSVRWSSTQRARWGSCTPETGTIRLSDRMRDFPRWVVDYVLVHELAHLRYSGHGPPFWALVNRYPLTERARGYLLARGETEGVEEG